MIEVCGKQIKVDGKIVRTGRLDAELYVSLDDPEALIQSLRSSREPVDLFTFMQMPPETEAKYNFPMKLGNVAALEISTFDHWWNHQIDKKTRNMARQAGKKGVTLREVPFDNTLVRGIWEIYNECPIRQGRRFSHFGETLETVHRTTATFLDRSTFIGAFFEENLIGFIKMTANDTGTHAGLMNILSMIKHRDKSPTNALIAEAVRCCANHNIPCLIYSGFTYGKREVDTLMQFKQHNGFKRVNLPRYYVPLTFVGHAALRLGLHESLTSLFPKTLLATLREWRTAWYKRKFPLEGAL